jgi:ribosomal protein L7/L12
MSDDYEIMQLRGRVAELEAQVKYLFQHLGVSYTPAAAGAASDPRMAKVIEQLRKNNLIEAIKEYRAITNTGLAEAKDAVEKLRSSLGFR